jgi:hypothetical protein
MVHITSSYVHWHMLERTSVQDLVKDLQEGGTVLKR